VTVTPLDTIDLPLDHLTPYPGNPRRGDVQEIRKSLRRLGQYRPLVVRATGTEYVILAGNHTHKAMRAEGWQDARVELIECSDDEAARINAADNRVGELPSPETGERYDREALADQLTSFGGDFEGTGWTADDLAALLDDGDEDTGEGDADEDDIIPSYGVIVTCDSEQQQARLLEQLDAEGFKVRALVA
jgi:ParB-like chromosome segregation protein Spo0J